MVDNSKPAVLFAMTIMVTALGFSFIDMGATDEANEELHERLDRMDRLLIDQNRKIDWMMKGMQEREAKNQPLPPPEPPPPPKPEPKKMPWGDMFDCVYNYDGMLQEIDTVANPNTHDSWVLGGQCEQLAHDLRDNEYEDEVWNPELAGTLDLKGMCVGYTDDSPIEAAKCQKNMQRWLEVFCWNTLTDGGIRACKRFSLMTSLDHEPDEKPW